MACFTPLTAWYSKQVNPTGKRSLVFNPGFALEPDSPVEVSCGQCAGCRLDRSKNWAVRCMHEAQMHEENCFITLTFDEKSLWSRPNPGSLCNVEHQLFVKRLRKFVKKKSNFICVENTVMKMVDLIITIAYLVMTFLTKSSIRPRLKVIFYLILLALIVFGLTVLECWVPLLLNQPHMSLGTA